jgi:predicted ATPase/serine phosphatase RsbU (regulator of sigma subunit)/tRNA A-37 threonylcarbamoyl transferase component Bud32
MTQVPGYEILEEIGRGATSVVYRAKNAGRLVALKVMAPRGGTPDVETALRFRREAVALARVQDPGVVKVIEAGEAEGRSFVSMELIGGGPLRARLEVGALAHPEVLRITKALASALAEVHRHGLVHRDLKPDNILLDEHGLPHLIDFGLAVAAAGEKGDAIAGTLLYCSPEQTHALKRQIDGRSDLYSLGVIVFECLTGKRPFDSPDAGRLIQLHVSTPAPHARDLNPAISPVLSAIVDKLLAKDPDDRYQSAEGLLADLDQLTALEDALAKGTLTLGTRDRPSRPEAVRLVGRDRELQRLKTAWEQTLQRRGAVLLVEGEAGLGKSRLCFELQKTARAGNGLVLTSKCRAAEQIPYAPLREAIDEHVVRLLRADEAVRAKGLAELRRASGEQTALLKRLSPALAQALGPAPDVPAADPNVEQDRFFGAFAMFLEALAAEAGSLLFVVDDVQWVDGGSLRILERVAGRTSTAPLLVLASARNDADSRAAREGFVSGLAIAAEHRLVLEPLDDDAVAELIAEHLGGHHVSPDFSARLGALAHGNPLAVGEYVRRMLDDGKIRPAAGEWVIEAKDLNELKLPSDVLGLLIGRIESLSASTRPVLTAAAVMGHGFHRKALLRVLGAQAEGNALAEAVRASLIEQTDDDAFAFVHDRIREALLAAADPALLKDLHQRTAEDLKAHDPGNVFAIARHLSLGHPDKNPQAVFEANFAAGGTALQSYSNGEAYEFLSKAQAAALKAGIPAPQRMPLTTTLGIAAMLTGQYDEANRLLSEAIAGTQEPLARAGNVMMLCFAKAGNGRTGEAWDDLQRALEGLNAGLPKDPAELQASYTALRQQIREREQTGRDFGTAHGPDAAFHGTLAALYDLGQFLASLTLRPEVIRHLAARQTDHALYLGNTEALSRAYSNLALGVAVIYEKAESYALSAKAQQIAEQLGDRAALVRAKGNQAVSQAFIGDLIDSEATFEKSLGDIEKWLGEFMYTIYLGSLIWNRYGRGYHRESSTRLVNALPRYDRAHNLTFSALQRIELFASFAVLGDTTQALRWQKEAYEVAKPYIKPEGISEPYLRGCLAIYSAFAYFELNDLEKAEACVEDFRALGASDYYFAGCYVTAAYLRLEQHRRAKAADRPAAWKKLEQAVLELAAPAWATPVYTCHLHAVRAAMATEKEAWDDADNELAQAERLAQQVASEWGRFEAARGRARLRRAQKQEERALEHAQEALTLAARHGWVGRARRVREEFGLSATTVEGSLASANFATITEGSRGISRRLLDALLELSATSSVMDPGLHAATALDKMLGLLAGQRAFLFLKNPRSGALELKAGRDDAQHDLKELSGYSSTVVDRVFRTGEALIVTGTEEGALLGSESAVAHDLRSIMAAPLRVRDALQGVVYLDSKIAKGLFTEEDFQILTPLASQMAVSIQTAQAARAEAERREMAKELELTATVQALLLPKERSFTAPRRELAGVYCPAAQCSGDWFWWEQQGNGDLLVFLGDVTGHGAASAMVTTAIATAYKAQRKHDPSGDPDALLRYLNAQLFDLAKGRYSMTFSATRITEHGELSIWFAGSPPALLADGGPSPRALSAKSSALGSAEFSPGVVKQQLQPNQRLLLFTDGLVELEAGGGRQLGLRGLSKLLKSCEGLPCSEAAKRLLSSATEGMAGQSAADDITFLLIDYGRV